MTSAPAPTKELDIAAEVARRMVREVGRVVCDRAAGNARGAGADLLERLYCRFGAIPIGNDKWDWGRLKRMAAADAE